MIEAGQQNITTPVDASRAVHLRNREGVPLSPAEMAREIFSSLELALLGLRRQIEEGAQDDRLIAGLDWLTGMASDAIDAVLATERGERASLAVFAEVAELATACNALPGPAHG